MLCVKRGACHKNLPVVFGAVYGAVLAGAVELSDIFCEERFLKIKVRSGLLTMQSIGQVVEDGGEVPALQIRVDARDDREEFSSV